MEAEKEKNLPEKSPSFASTGGGEDNTNHSDHNQDQDHHQNNESDNVPPAEPPVEVEHKIDDTETKTETVTENIEEEPTETNIPPPDLNQVSKEIDQFISVLSSAKEVESEPPEVPEFVEQFAFLVEANIANNDSGENPVKWSQLAEEDSSSFLEATDRISKLTTLLSQFSSESKYASSVNRIGGILQRAMSYLEYEFRSLLEDPKNLDSLDQQASGLSSNQEADHCFSPEIRLHRRKQFSRVLGRGFEMVSIDDVQRMQWESLEREIVSWIKTFKQCTTVIFSSERKLSEVVFSNYTSISESLFGSLSRGLTIELLNFAEAVAMTKRSAEKLFKFLDIYETLRDVIPTMDDIFPNECIDEMKSEASLTRRRLGEAIICVFCELENSIKADTGKTPVPGGAVHPLTRYTMNYLKYACEYKDTLEQVFREHQKIERADSAGESDYNYNALAAESKQRDRKSIAVCVADT
ncbi:hypothetical protein F0562_004475 [Nyssa sinensis]|uniref:Exocyst subunit Exo70 family protein n=1 Tax=Nyssa sinensis TaxID=561372 RepID=A0A5J5C049_9ASTE|nr:hypothetical protein F0562_004475 [Nyssa sinensis]